jgi:hypothetical protein
VLSNLKKKGKSKKNPKKPHSYPFIAIHNPFLNF